MRIQTQISINDSEYKENYSKQFALCNELDDIIKEIKLGGGERSILREKKKGKLTARERIDFLVDDDSEFLELSALAARASLRSGPKSTKSWGALICPLLFRFRENARSVQYDIVHKGRGRFTG